MSETTTSYIVVTKEAQYTGKARSDTRIDGVIGVSWDDGVLSMGGANGPLFVAPMEQVVYFKRFEPNVAIGSATLTYRTSGQIDAPAIHQALINLKRSTGKGLGLA